MVYNQKSRPLGRGDLAECDGQVVKGQGEKSQEAKVSEAKSN